MASATWTTPCFSKFKNKTLLPASKAAWRNTAVLPAPQGRTTIPDLSVARMASMLAPAARMASKLGPRQQLEEAARLGWLGGHPKSRGQGEAPQRASPLHALAQVKGCTPRKNAESASVRNGCARAPQHAVQDAPTHKLVCPRSSGAARATAGFGGAPAPARLHARRDARGLPFAGDDLALRSWRKARVPGPWTASKAAEAVPGSLAFACALPRCCDLASAGARWWKRKRKENPNFPKGGCGRAQGDGGDPDRNGGSVHDLDARLAHAQEALEDPEAHNFSARVRGVLESRGVAPGMALGHTQTRRLPEAHLRVPWERVGLATTQTGGTRLGGGDQQEDGERRPASRPCLPSASTEARSAQRPLGFLEGVAQCNAKDHV